MEKTNLLMIAAVAVIFILLGVVYYLQNQTPQMPGSDKDSHGCILSAGYTWCEAKQKCLRTWEENCTAELAGGDKDSHGCIPSAGYSWCARKQQCVRTWEDGCFRVMTEDYPPYNFRAANGTISGACTEIVEIIATSINHNISIELGPLSAGFSAALNESDVILFSIARTSAREDLFKWAGPISPSEREVFYVPSNAYVALTRLEDARALSSICVYKSDFRAQKLEAENFTNLVYGLDDIDCTKRLANGSVQAWVGNPRVLSDIANTHNLNMSDFRSTDFVLIENSFYIAFSKDVPDDTVQLWQEKLNELKQNGTFNATMAKYGLGN